MGRTSFYTKWMISKSCKVMVIISILSITNIHNPSAAVDDVMRDTGFSAFYSFDEMASATDATVPVARAVTRGPKFHWFGYYDKFQLDPGGRFLLSMEADFTLRMPESGEVAKVGMIDLENDNRWIELGETSAWNFQQGCMLQWRPGSDREVVWNDLEDGRFVCRVLDIKTHKLRTLPRAIGTISPDGKMALCEDNARISNLRPVVGYAGVVDKYAGDPAPAESGVWLMDMDTGEIRMLVSVADLVKIPYPGQSPDHMHYIGHLSWSPEGNRFLMFNRYPGYYQPTRIFTMNADGSDLRLLSARRASHWAWRDEKNIVIWGEEKAYCIYKDDGTGESKTELWKAPNGHHSFVPATDKKWVITDTYAQGEKREQFLYLYHLPTKRFVFLGRFHSPLKYYGNLDCDLHPRLSRDGKRVIFDSPHGGNGRQQYMIDISLILAEGVHDQSDHR